MTFLITFMSCMYLFKWVFYFFKAETIFTHLGFSLQISVTIYFDYFWHFSKSRSTRTFKTISFINKVCALFTKPGLVWIQVCINIVIKLCIVNLFLKKYQTFYLNHLKLRSKIVLSTYLYDTALFANLLIQACKKRI